MSIERGDRLFIDHRKTENELFRNTNRNILGNILLPFKRRSRVEHITPWLKVERIVGIFFQA